MKNERILNAVGKISDELIEDAAISTQQSKTGIRWKTLIASAACFCLLLTAAFMLPHFFSYNPAGTVPSATAPSSNTSQEHNNYTPFLSAQEVAGVFTSLIDRNDTNSYTVEVFPKNYFANHNTTPNEKTAAIYHYLTTGSELDINSIKTFSGNVFGELEKALGTKIPSAEFVKDDGIMNYLFYSEQETYAIMAEQNRLNETVAVLASQYQPLTFFNEPLQIDLSMSDSEILAQFVPTAEVINSAMGTDFSDISITRYYSEYSPNGVNSICIFLYNSADEPGTKIRKTPMLDYIVIEFFNIDTSGENNIINAGLVRYVHQRIPVKNRLVTLSEEFVLTLEQAEMMLEKGYVFGGHSCRLCMQAQEKLDFSEYDYVGFEYVTGEADSDGNRLCIPFYTFYKRLDPASNGNERYAKTYVCAVQMAGVDNYFEMQLENHN